MARIQKLYLTEEEENVLNSRLSKILVYCFLNGISVQRTDSNNNYKLRLSRYRITSYIDLKELQFYQWILDRNFAKELEDILEEEFIKINGKYKENEQVRKNFLTKNK